LDVGDEFVTAASTTIVFAPEEFADPVLAVLAELALPPGKPTVKFIDTNKT
jgi:hypothetical protein